MITVYQYLNQQSLTVPTPPSRFLSLSFPLNLAVVSTDENASLKREMFVQETEATICDYKGALELWSTNGYALSEV